MRNALWLFGLLACGGDKDESAQDDTGSPAPLPCEVTTIDATWPTEGLDPTSQDATVQVWFSGVASAEGTSLTLTDASGAAVAGTLTLAEGTASFTPDALLGAGTTYSWAATVCDATASGSFTTGQYGETVDPAAMVDLAFAIDLADATWVQPEGGESLFAGLFSGVILLGVEAADSEQLDLIAAVGEVVDEETVQQDPCFATADFEPADFRNNPYAEVGPTSLEVDVEGIAVPLHNVNLTGAFVNGGAGLEGGVLTAEGDIRDVASSLGFSDDDACAMLDTYLSIECGECAEDGEPYCVALELHDVAGVEQPGITVVPNENPSECTEGGA